MWVQAERCLFSIHNISNSKHIVMIVNIIQNQTPLDSYNDNMLHLESCDNVYTEFSCVIMCSELLS